MRSIPPSETRIRQIAHLVNRMMQGKLNVTGSVTLSSGSSQTTLSDAKIGPGSFIHLMAKTANAAGENWWITASSNGTATINHANSSTSDRSFIYIVMG